MADFSLASDVYVHSCISRSARQTYIRDPAKVIEALKPKNERNTQWCHQEEQEGDSRANGSAQNENREHVLVFAFANRAR